MRTVTWNTKARTIVVFITRSSNSDYEYSSSPVGDSIDSSVHSLLVDSGTLAMYLHSSSNSMMSFWVTS